MSKSIFFKALSFCILLFAACQQAPAPESAAPKGPQPDMNMVKTEIQALENAWAAADNARDAAAVMAFYSDDARSMPNNAPTFVGKAAIQKDIESSLAKRKEGSTVSYETLEVFGNENLVTETGKITAKDVTGTVTYTGKYMAIWEKRDGKWLTIRDMNNDDVKEK